MGFKKVPSNTLHDRPRPETTQTSINSKEMWYIHTKAYSRARKMNETQLPQHVDETHKHNTEYEKPDTQNNVYLLHYCIYVKLTKQAKLNCVEGVHAWVVKP